MSWTASRADKHFSGVRSISDAVQPADAGAPACCARTRITLRCRHDERAFVFTMPAWFGTSPWFYTFSGSLHSDGVSGFNLDGVGHDVRDDAPPQCAR